MGEREICRFVLSQMGGADGGRAHMTSTLGGGRASKKKMKIGRSRDLYCISSPNADKDG